MKHSTHIKGVNKTSVNKKGGDIMHSLASVKGNNNLLLAEMDKFIDKSENPEEFFKLQKLARESNKFISNLIDEVQEHETIFIDREDKLNKINSVMNDFLTKIEEKIQELREKDISEGYLLCYHYRIISIDNCLNKIKNNIWYKNYKLKDLMSTDYSEIIDETLKHKSLLLNSNI